MRQVEEREKLGSRPLFPPSDTSPLLSKIHPWVTTIHPTPLEEPLTLVSSLLMFEPSLQSQPTLPLWTYLTCSPKASYLLPSLNGE